MSLTIRTLEQQKREGSNRMTVVLKQRTYKTKDGRACLVGPDAAFLVGPVGARITDEQAVALGLVDGRVVVAGTESEQEAIGKSAPQAENKADAPAENKAAAPAEDKTATPRRGRPSKKHDPVW